MHAPIYCLLRGGATFSTPVLKIGALNVTSLPPKYWRSVAELDMDIIALSETRVTRQEQELLEGRLATRGKKILWSSPLDDSTHGMQGRSGGAALLINPSWHILQQEMDLPLMAAKRYWCYGHPGAEATTIADLELIAKFAATMDIQVLVLGDLNLKPEQISSNWCDLIAIQEAKGQEIGPTFYGPQGVSAPDRLLATPQMAMMNSCRVSHDVAVPNHKLVVATFAKKVIYGIGLSHRCRNSI